MKTASIEDKEDMSYKCTMQMLLHGFIIAILGGPVLATLGFMAYALFEGKPAMYFFHSLANTQNIGVMILMGAIAAHSVYKFIACLKRADNIW